MDSRNKEEKIYSIQGSTTGSVIIQGENNINSINSPFNTEHTTSDTLSPVEKLYLRQIEMALSRKAGNTSTDEFQTLLIILSKALNSFVSSGSIPNQSTNTPISRALLEEIQKEKIPIGQTLISFGSASQIGDVSFQDVAAGNIIKITINLVDSSQK